MEINILIVDDNQANLDTLEYMIKDIEFKDNLIINIFQADNGNDALSIAMKNDIALIILDIQMPEMDGFEVAKYLKKTKKTQNIPICFLTAAFKSEQMREYGLHLGAFDYFHKPIDPLILVPKIKLYINFYANTKELKNINIDLEEKIKKAIEEHSKIEAKLNQAEKLASMVEMIGNIAHQWRQPLSVISTAATGVKVKKEYDMLDDEFLITSMDTISSATNELSKTIDNLGNILAHDEENKTFINLSGVIEKCLKIEENSIFENHIKIISDLDDSIEINSLPHSLLQAIISIFNNAKDAICLNQDDNNRIIFITTKKEDDKVSITMRDTGGGIDDEIIDKIFEPYFTTKHQTQGAGLGLHTTYQAVHSSLNGTIDINNIHFEYEQKEYKGVDVILTLPIDGD
jgi:signal transduction histidine kinase